MSGGQHSAKEMKIAERQNRAVALRKSGATFRGIAAQIAKEMPEFPNYDGSMAYRDVQAVFDRLQAEALEDAATMRLLESERLDMASLAIARQVQSGDLQAIDRWIKLVEARAKLWGLHLPPAERPINEETATGIELELIS